MFKNSLDEILIDLINLRSVSGEEDNIFSEIKKYFKKLNFKTDLEYQNNIVFDAEIQSQKTILLVGHLDTVLAQNVDQYKAKKVIEKNETLIYGRGACDMKAGVAAMLKLAYDIKKGVYVPKYNLKFLFYSGEEAHLPNGLNFLFDKGLKKEDFALVLEPTSNRVAIACLGTTTFKVKIKGEACHSSIPWRGSNAIYNALNFIEKIKNTTPIEKIYEGIKAISSISVTQACTYNSHNVIPDSLELILNYRFLPDLKRNDVVNFIDYKITKDYEILDFSPACISENIFLSELNKFDKFIYQGWCDMAQLVEYGIPTIAFGPGDESYAHQVNEHIKLSDLENYYDNLLDVLNK